MTANAWSVKSASEIRASLDLLVKILGDIPLADVDTEKASALFWTVSLLPSNWNKKPEYRGKTAAELTAKYKKMSAENLMKNPPTGTLSAKTVNKTMDRISSFWAWAIEKDYATKQLFRNLRKKDDSIPDENRGLFQPHQLCQIFQAPTFTAKETVKPFQYWAPLIALFTGMRQTEIGQLYVSDIRLEQEIWVIDVNKNTTDKKLKNKYSKRLVPIHSHLLSLGIVQYRDTLQKAGQTRLFPELNYSAMNGYGDDISDWFAEFRASVGIPKDGPVFHSFRHTVATAFLHASVAEAIAAKILGHSHEAITFGTYGKKPIEILKDTIETLDFGDALVNVVPWTAMISKTTTGSRRSPVTV